jgi:hypothetical protein
MLYKVALDPIMLYKVDNHSLNKVEKVHSNRFKLITNQFSYNTILINFLQLVSIQILINFL